MKVTASGVVIFGIIRVTGSYTNVLCTGDQEGYHLNKWHFLKGHDRRSAQAVIPQYGIRGTVPVYSVYILFTSTYTSKISDI